MMLQNWDLMTGRQEMFTPRHLLLAPVCPWVHVSPLISLSKVFLGDVLSLVSPQHKTQAACKSKQVGTGVSPLSKPLEKTVQCLGDLIYSGIPRPYEHCQGEHQLWSLTSYSNPLPPPETGKDYPPGAR
jgi:hypothetical protein